MTALPIFDPDWSTVSAMLSPFALPATSAFSLVPLEIHGDRPRIVVHPIHDRLVGIHPGAVHRPGGLVQEQVPKRGQDSLNRANGACLEGASQESCPLFGRKARLAVVRPAADMELVKHRSVLGFGIRITG